MGGKLKVTERALTQRINRRLAVGKPRKKLFKANASEPSGWYVVMVNLDSGRIIREDVNLSKLARELGALKAWEEVES
jgi:hypothetical protein